MPIERIELPVKSRAARLVHPRYIILHSTQGATTIERQYSATVSWFRAGGDPTRHIGYGPSCDILIGHDGREAWFTRHGADYHASRANWSAGFGASSTTTYGADEYGISIELAQTNKGERPPMATLEAAVARCAALCREFAITPQRLTYLSQRRNQPVPSGIVGHEDTENGRKTGKWDPNAATFPWAWFVAAVRSALGSEGGYVDKDYTVIREGEWLSRVASRVGLSVEDLVRLNGIADANKVEAWQVLRLHDGVPRPPARSTRDPGLYFADPPALVGPERQADGSLAYEARVPFKVVMP